MAEGFRPIVVKEAVGDRVAGTVAWNLFDIDNNLPNLEGTVPMPALSLVEQAPAAPEFASA